MQHNHLKLAAFIVGGMLAASPAFADKHSSHGHGKADKQEWNEHRDDERDYDDRRDERDYGQNRYFDDRHRAVIHDYYAEQSRSGNCPPGLAKKHNGCMPPGQAKKWQIGRPLPSDVAYYDLPPAILDRLGAPMPGYRYAQVGPDVLLISIGTRMVMDAIMGLGGH